MALSKDKSLLKSFRKMWLGVAGSLLLPACGAGVPSQFIQPSELEDILYDYHMAQSMAEIGGDSMNYRRYSYVQAVFEKYGITEAEFDSTMLWYSSHATYLRDIYKRLGDRYSEHVTALGASTGENDIYAHLDAQGDTANIWQGYTFRVLRPRFTEDRMQFTMPADTTFRKGDALLWRFESRYISHGQQNEGYAGFYVTYDNDSTVGVTRRVYSNGQMQLRVEGDTAHAIREIGGFVYYKSLENEQEPRFLILRDMMLVRFHRHFEPADADTVSAAADSLQALPADSLRRAVPDTNSVRVVSPRLSPEQLRDSRPVERSINVVKEKPYRVIRKGNTRRSSSR